MAACLVPRFHRTRTQRPWSPPGKGHGDLVDRLEDGAELVALRGPQHGQHHDHASVMRPTRLAGIGGLWMETLDYIDEMRVAQLLSAAACSS